MTALRRPTMAESLEKRAPRRPRQRSLGRWDPRDSSEGRAAHHGLTAADVDAMVVRQGGHCLLCGKPLGTTFVVDHDHVLARLHGHDEDHGCPRCVRGLLCPKDNSLLGWGGDDPAYFRRLADYIELARASGRGT